MKMKNIVYTVFLLTAFCVKNVSAQTDSLRQQILRVIHGKQATIAMSVRGIETSDTLSVNGQLHLPMQSVFKFHIALAVLNEVDKGKFKLDQNILIKKSDLLPDTYSPLRDDFPNGNVNVPLSKIIDYTVAHSDNNGCDIQLRLIGGPAKVDQYMKKIGIKDININASEEDMHKEWNVQFSNWTTMNAATDLLKKFYQRKMLSRQSYEFLWKTMLATSTGKDRIKSLLPAGTLVAHKTGTSDKKDGIKAAINDIGIVTLPNGKHYAISVFVTNSKEDDGTNARIIADISKLCWDYFVRK